MRNGNSTKLQLVKMDVSDVLKFNTRFISWNLVDLFQYVHCFYDILFYVIVYFSQPFYFPCHNPQYQQVFFLLIAYNQYLKASDFIDSILSRSFNNVER
jgi:hypothetical protein